MKYQCTNLVHRFTFTIPSPRGACAEKDASRLIFFRMFMIIQAGVDQDLFFSGRLYTQQTAAT